MCRRISSHAIDYPGDLEQAVSHPLRRDSACGDSRVQPADPSRVHAMLMLQPFFAWKNGMWNRRRSCQRASVGSTGSTRSSTSAHADFSRLAVPFISGAEAVDDMRIMRRTPSQTSQ